MDGGRTLSVNTLKGRVRCPFASQPLWKDCLAGSWKLGTAKLIELKGLWYLHIPASKEVEDFQKEQVLHVVGIDRGLRFLSVCYDEQRKTQFESGKKIAFQQANAMSLPFADESFDVLINEGMLTVLPPVGKIKCIQEYLRVLKPGGVLLTQDICRKQDDAQAETGLPTAEE